MNHLPSINIVGLGELLWDMLPEGRKLGGAPANFVYNISQFGFPAKVVSAVGDDIYGRDALAELDRKGIASMVAVLPESTGRVDVKLDGSGVPCYDIKEHVAWDFIPMGRELRNLAHDTTVACFGTLAQRSPVSRATVNMFLDTMPDGRGRLKVFDINLRQGFYSKEVVEQSLTRCNILKINDEELSVVGRLLGCRDLPTESVCRRLVNDYSLDCLVLTCGAKGSYVFGKRGGMSFIESPAVRVVDTVGAGDSFTAAFVASLLVGKSIEEAHRRAVDVAAYVCSCPGAMCPLPDHLTAL